MKIVIELSKKEVYHLVNCNSHIDSCSYVTKVVDKIKKKLPKQKSFWSTKRVPKIVKLKLRG